MHQLQSRLVQQFHPCVSTHISWLWPLGDADIFPVFTDNLIFLVYHTVFKRSTTTGDSLPYSPYINKMQEPMLGVKHQVPSSGGILFSRIPRPWVWEACLLIILPTILLRSGLLSCHTCDTEQQLIPFFHRVNQAPPPHDSGTGLDLMAQASGLP